MTKLLDLDRCYSKHRILTDDGNTFVLYNLHLSAYTSDGTIVTKQLQRLIDDMDREYALGNYCVAGGDFNKDLLGNSADYFGASDREYTWAQPIPEEVLAGHPVSLVAPLNEKNPVPSCRNADGPYHEGQYVLTIDGFLVTDNVKVLSSGVVDTGFAYSDHNPVRMTFSLDRDYPEIVSSAEDADRPFRYEDSAILAQTEFDLDRDGKKENVVLAFGPTSGLFTVRLVTLQDGEHRYGEIFVITPVDQPSFREKDGDLYLTFSDLSGDGTETVSFRVELIGKRIALISDNDHAYAWYWGS